MVTLVTSDSQILDTIIQGDCLGIMRTLPDASVDCILTDPPFSSGTRREANKGLRKSMTRSLDDERWFASDCLTTTGFLWLMRECALEWHRILKNGSHILVFIDWRMMPSLASAIESADLRHVGLLVWDKTYFGLGSCFRNQHELILHFSKGRGLDPQRKDVGNVIACSPIRNGKHPTEKPVKLLSTLLNVVCPQGGTVLDCFVGSGSTCIAAKQEKMHYIGIEREAEYVAISRQRISEAMGLWEGE